jgi:hypothetical protein
VERKTTGIFALVARERPPWSALVPLAGGNVSHDKMGEAMCIQQPRFRKQSAMLRHCICIGVGVVCLLLLSCTTVAAQGAAVPRRTALVIDNAA